MPFLEHLEELRWRIIKSIASVVIAMMAAFPFTGKLLNLLTLPNAHLKEPAELIFLKPTGMLMVRIEIAITVGVIVSLPIIFYQIWQFVMPGLYPSERKYLLPGLLFTTLCFLGGASFCYFVLIPNVLPFLFNLGTASISPKINITEYMSFILRLILVFGIVFELPIISYVLARVGILSPHFLRKYRRYGIVIVFIIAAILTPPDPLSQLLMAFPLLFLYEISIWTSILAARRRKERNEEE